MTAVTNRRFLSLHQPGCTNKAFTLIELLVVIAIISLLVSILLPSLQRAKQLAIGVKCKAHLRKAGVMAQMYAADNGSWWIIYGTNDPPESRWSKDRSWAAYAERAGYLDFAWDYGGEEEQRDEWFFCPSSEVSADDFNTIRRRTFGTNYKGYYRGVPGFMDADGNTATGAWNDSKDCTNGHYAQRVVTETYKYPSVEIYLIFDGLEKPADYFMLGDTLMSGGAPMNQSAMAKSDVANQNTPTFWGVHDSAGDSANMAFGDSHIETITNDDIAENYIPEDGDEPVCTIGPAQ